MCAFSAFYRAAVVFRDILSDLWTPPGACIRGCREEELLSDKRHCGDSAGMSRLACLHAYMRARQVQLAKREAIQDVKKYYSKLDVAVLARAR